MKKFIVILLIVTIFYNFSCEEKTEGYTQPRAGYIDIIDYTTSKKLGYIQVKCKKNLDTLVSHCKSRGGYQSLYFYEQGIRHKINITIAQSSTKNYDFYEHINLYDTNTNFIFKITNKILNLSYYYGSSIRYLYISNETLTNAYWGTTNE